MSRRAKHRDIETDNNIDDSKVMFPKKLKEANEMLEKYPPPPEVLMHGYSELEKQYGFEVNGILKRADADAKTFLVIKLCYYILVYTQYEYHTYRNARNGKILCRRKISSDSYL